MLWLKPSFTTTRTFHPRWTPTSIHAPSLPSHIAHSTLGIDLGTSNSAVATVRDGKPVMLHIGAATTIPSLVAYDQHGVVQAVGGDDTQHGAVCFYSTKRLLGLAYDDAAARVGDRMLYGIAPGPDGRAWLQVPGSDGQVLLKDTIEVTAVLLKHIVDSALGAMRDEHGVDEQLKAVVIGVPAHFSEAQRQATLQAAALAGIEGVQLLQEPVAAALAYGITSATRHETVLVFDLGGGTFDCSLLSTFAGIAEVLTTGGDQWLGGDDWDAAMLCMLRDMLMQHGIDMDMVEDGVLLRAVQQIKVALSDVQAVTIEVGELMGGREKQHQDGMLHVERDVFEDATARLLARTLVPLQQLGEEGFVQWATSPSALLGEAAQPDDDVARTPSSDPYAPPPRRIDQVVLVGGATRMPQVRALVSTLTGCTPRDDVDPEHAVALGCALQAGMLTGSVRGLEVMDGAYVEDAHDRLLKQLVKSNHTLTHTTHAIAIECPPNTAIIANTIFVCGIDIAPTGAHSPSTLCPTNVQSTQKAHTKHMTFTQFIVVLGVAAMAFGPKELPKVARVLGVLTGQAAGSIFALRQRMSQLAEHTEIHELNKEVQASMVQLDRIRSELKSGVDIFNPGPLTSRIITSATTTATPTPPTQTPPPPTPPQEQHTPPPPSQAPATPPSGNTTPHQQHQHQQHINIIPVSAVAAGMVPDRSSTTPVGSDVVLDALLEEHVARQAHAFYASMKQPGGGGDGGGSGGGGGNSSGSSRLDMTDGGKKSPL